MEEVKHYSINRKYRVVFEQSAVKGILGFKVEANSDSIEEARKDAEDLLKWAQEKAPVQSTNMEVK